MLAEPARVLASLVACPSCGSDRAVRCGLDSYVEGKPRQAWKCKSCGRRFIEGRQHSRAMVLAGVNLVREGLSTREASIRLHAIYGVWVSNVTVSRWAIGAGVKLAPNVRAKPCSFCGSKTAHKHSCPEWKSGAHIKEEKNYLV